MKIESLIYGIIGLIVGGLMTMVFFSNQTNESTSKADPSPVDMQHGTSMQDMVANLKGKTGDEFDKEFIKGMIEHHEGAIEMANEAKVSAKHDEIKKMADEIVSAQSKEIDQMNKWKQEWGY